MQKLTVISLGAGVQSSVMAFGDECDGMCGV
jgi:hypothetical protein